MPLPPDKLTETEQVLLEYLRKRCWGRAAARTQKWIAAVLGWPRRHVHEVAGALRRHGYAVGSSCGRPLGMYVCATHAEREQVMAQLKHRLVEQYRTMRQFGHAPIEGMERQLMLFGAEEAVAVDGTSRPMAEAIMGAADA